MDYPIKILMAFALTFDEKGTEFRQWLMDNGYPELAALSDAVKGSKSALKWLMDNKLYHFAAFDSAIDGKEKAKQWLLKFHFDILALTAAAVNKDADAIRILMERDLRIYIIIAEKIRQSLENNKFDYHKLPI